MNAMPRSKKFAIQIAGLCKDDTPQARPVCLDAVVPKAVERQWRGGAKVGLFQCTRERKFWEYQFQEAQGGWNLPAHRCP